MELLVIFEFECMPGSNSCSATFFCSNSLGSQPFHAFVPIWERTRARYHRLPADELSLRFSLVTWCPLSRSRVSLLERSYAGTFLSSLDMAGISISVLSERRLAPLAGRTNDSAFVALPKQRPHTTFSQITTNVVTPVKSAAAGSHRLEAGAKLRRTIKAVCRTLIERRSLN
jgi:hypothetical protein